MNIDGVDFMKISEILSSSEDQIRSKIGDGPFLYYSGDEIIIDCSLERIIGFHVQDGTILSDIEIYAYGFKKSEGDERAYINPDDLKKRFEQMDQEGVYEIITPEEENGKTVYVPSYCGFEELLYFVENGEDYVVNCRPIKQVIEEETQKRIEKSDALRR